MLKRITYNVFEGDLVLELLSVFANVDSFILECSVSLLYSVEKTVLWVELREQVMWVDDGPAASRDVSVILRSVSDSGQAKHALTRFDQKHALRYCTSSLQELTVSELQQAHVHCNRHQDCRCQARSTEEVVLS